MIASPGAATPVPGSFRDPSGGVFERDGRIFRTVNAVAAGDFDFVRQTPFYAAAIAAGHLVEARLLDADEARDIAPDAVYVVEHPRLPYVSFPYEWSFPALKAAALLHLDLQVEALSAGVMFSDATAYNVQFVGHRPVFIDTLSLRAYRKGELWAGHRQFCEQFLNPLLLRAFLGVTHNAWYRGALGGIPTSDLRRLIPMRRKLSRLVGTHVVLQDVLQQSAGKRSGVDKSAVGKAGLPRASLDKLLRGLRNWIAGLTPRDNSNTTWRDYAGSHSYSSEEAATKKTVIQDFVRRCAPRQVWDIGCNTGDYSVAALEAGAAQVIGFDFDQGAIELAYARAVEGGLHFLPLLLDASNPSPSQGWAQTERPGFGERAGADGVIALALVHHLAIAGNVPLDQVLRWLVGLAPRGIIEFVPKADPMVAELLRFRPDIFPGYHEDAFLAHLGALARVERRTPSSATGRVLVEFARDTDG